MSEKSKNKREWVKTAAIIFLSVMLVLTFFSQTIMNYSLPIVTAQYINSGQISAKVRGSGKIESADLYNVQIPETRDIQSIEVKKGDKVEKDQVMIHLKDKESDELKKAKEELETLQVSYKKALLDGGISDFVYYDAVAGREDSTDGYRAKIKAAKARVENLDAQIDALETQQRTGSYDADSLEIKIKNALDAKTAAEAKMNGIEVSTPSDTYANASEAKKAMDSYATVMESSRITKDNAKAKMDEKAAEIAKYQSAYNARVSIDNDANITDKDGAFGDWLTANSLNTGLTLALLSTTTSGEISDIINTKNTETGGYDELADAFKTAQDAYDKDYALYAAAASAYNSYGASSSSQTAKNSAKSEYEAAKANYDNLVAMQSNAQLSGKELENKIAQLKAEMENAQADLDQLLKDIPGEIELNSTARVLKEKQEELQKLLDNAIGATIDAPIAGTIVDVNVVSGGKAEANATVVTIQPENKGFTLSVPVTAEQAKKVSVGSVAEVQNSWYYNDITVELKKIQNDPANPGKSKLLVFDVSGDVSAGQELSISVGSKSQGYDMIVPNSAIRSDNNGKFILIVESKSSPIGNRYYASRVDIEVLAEDDTSTAISAPIDSWQYVITAANKPVEAGKQVRLQD